MDPCRVALVLGVMIAAPVVTLAQSSTGDRAAIAARADERIRVLQREADRLAAESRTLIGDLRRLEIEREINAEKLAAAEAELELVNAALESARERAAVLQVRRHEATPALAAELVEIYKRGRRGHAQRLLANLIDGRELGRLIRGAQALASIERARVEAHRRVVRAEETAVSELERRAADAARSRDAQAAARAALERSMREHNRMLEALDRDRDLAARYAGELQSARAELERTLTGLGAPGSPAALPIAPFKGDLPWPVRGVVRTRFGAAQPGHPPSTIVRHGIELEATERSPVSAVHGGRVSYAAPFFGRGMLVVVDHGHGVQSLYGYLADVAVRVGSVLDSGGLIGRAGPAGRGGSLDPPFSISRSGGAGLYFELRVDGRPVDPLQWLRSTP